MYANAFDAVALRAATAAGGAASGQPGLLDVSDYDLLVVGGGINGAAVARDAAGRGLSVLLCDKGDLGGATSSASSKLIHGGLRYLEHGAFRLVRESLAEREILLRAAPHLVRPLRFVLPLAPGTRPAWLLRAGLFLYDRLGGSRSLPAAAAVELAGSPLGTPLRPEAHRGFCYYDCSTDDARLTILVARDAALRGGCILPRHELIAARRCGGGWIAELRETGGAIRTIGARILVNAAGPWASEVARRSGITPRARLRLVKGSHIVLPRLYDGDHAYLLQNDDRRIVFVMPFERDWSLIGTTEAPFTGDAGAAAIGPDEIAYLCRAVGRWFDAAPLPADVVWSYAGVRPLFDDGARNASAASRDYVIELDAAAGAPALSVFGGKLTTHRRLAEAVLGRLAKLLPAIGEAWTAAAPLPGADLPPGGVAALADKLADRCRFLTAPAAARLAASYGSDVSAMFADGAGREFGHGFTEAELRWLAAHEWAATAEDVLWRRTKLGLVMTPKEAAAIDNYLLGVADRADCPNSGPPPPAGRGAAGPAAVGCR